MSNYLLHEEIINRPIQRNINLSMILLNPSKVFSELHASVRISLLVIVAFFFVLISDHLEARSGIVYPVVSSNIKSSYLTLVGCKLGTP